MPSAVAAIAATLVTLLPFIFKLDERYAKEETVVVRLAAIDKEMQDLSLEIGRLAGTQEVLVAIQTHT